MSERIESRMDRRRRRQQRRTGLLGLGILISSIAATVALLLVGPGSARGASPGSSTPVVAHVVHASDGAR
jgi:hypothetical protein